MARRTSTPATLPTLTDALAWLRANDAKTLATYCEVSGTVTAWRMTHTRRANGTIVGLYDGTARGRWESYARDAREYVAHKMRQASQKAAVTAHMADEAQEVATLRAAAVRSAIEALRTFRGEMSASMASVPPAVASIVREAAARREAELVAAVRFAWLLTR